jgi:hypothetical protein
MQIHGQRAVIGSWPRRFITAFALAPLALAGCGSDLYEERLANTQILMAHELLIRENLPGEWSDAENGLSLRIPPKFQMLPSPVRPEPAAKPAGEEEEKAAEEEVEVIDERQPKYVNVELPGLRGAFQASVKVIGGNNAEFEGDAWIYVMSNQDLAHKPDEAKDFTATFVKSLAAALEMSAPPPENFESIRIPPRVGNFVKPLKYTSVMLSPREDIGGFARQFSVYSYENGEVQAVILFVLPQNVDGSEKLTDRIPLCLETLNVNSSQLLQKTPGSGGGGGAASGPTF